MDEFAPEGEQKLVRVLLRIGLVDIYAFRSEGAVLWDSWPSCCPGTPRSALACDSFNPPGNTLRFHIPEHSRA